MKIFRCTEACHSTPPCILIIQDGHEPENCPYETWSGKPCPEWETLYSYFDDPTDRYPEDDWRENR